MIQENRDDQADAISEGISNNNKVYEGNIVLSPEGVKRSYIQLNAEIQHKGC